MYLEPKSTSPSAKGGRYVTNMKRVTVSLPDDVDKRLMKLKQTKKFSKSSYSEVIRQVLQRGLEKDSGPKAS